MTYTMRRAAVIGAGTMGAALAAHLANAGVSVLLLDIVPPQLTPEEQKRGLTRSDKEVRNRFPRSGLERSLKSRPADFFVPDLAARITIGNLEDDFEKLREVDWILEAIVENLEIKRELMARLDTVRAETAIVSTNTSGIPVTSIAQGRTAEFRRHFLGTHFFNPPRYLRLLEIIPTADTFPEVVDFMRRIGEKRLGKGVVICKDTPNFIANRVGTMEGLFVVDYALRHGYSVDEVDALTGPLIGYPRTATFRLFDLVGIDVLYHVFRNLYPVVPNDESRELMVSQPVLDLFKTMVDRNWLGGKTGQGFYKEVRKEGAREFWSLNLKTFEYEPPAKPRFESVGRAKDIAPLGERLKALLAAEDRASELLRASTYHGLAYASHRLPEIADSPLAVDQAMRWGFTHEQGPFETWDALGVRETARQMEAAGAPPADWVKEMLASEKESFYANSGARRGGVYEPARKGYREITVDPSEVALSVRKSESGAVLAQNDGASLIDLGQGVACVEFHTKMNALDTDIWDMLSRSLDRLEAGEFEGLVIGNEADNFSVGANLAYVGVAAQNKAWDLLEQGIRQFQQINMRIRFASRPVIAAPAGMALGGGCEITMASPHAVVAAESYLGLVEVGVGLIPAGGGTKEVVRRLVSPVMQNRGADALPALQRIFETVGQARASTSAEEARSLGFLSLENRLVMNRAHLLSEAKDEALHLAQSGYRPPIPFKVYAAGRDALAALRVGLHMFRESAAVTEYDAVVGGHLARVLCGGELASPAWVDEQYFLDLECEAFLSLCGESRTQERIWHMLQTGKPLRN
ncbi:MAG: 3-hydroxyacyl-CoA dehydrogenase/enoyl-CoA hydratase family protein [Anaerolineales bacterium]